MIVAQDDDSRTFFIIADGTVKITQNLTVDFDEAWKPEYGGNFEIITFEHDWNVFYDQLLHHSAITWV